MNKLMSESERKSWLARMDSLIKRVETFNDLNAHYHLCAKRWGMSFCNCPLRKLLMLLMSILLLFLVMCAAHVYAADIDEETGCPVAGHNPKDAEVMTIYGKRYCRGSDEFEADIIIDGKPWVLIGSMRRRKDTSKACVTRH
jgi:hypothetical protein